MGETPTQHQLLIANETREALRACYERKIVNAQVWHDEVVIHFAEGDDILVIEPGPNRTIKAWLLT